MGLEIGGVLAALGLDHRFCLGDRPEVVDPSKLLEDIERVARLSLLEERALRRVPNSPEVRDFNQQAAMAHKTVTNGLADRFPRWMLIRFFARSKQN